MPALRMHCELKQYGATDCKTRPLTHRFDDPINGDRVFAYVCSVSRNQPDAVLNFAIICKQHIGTLSRR